MNFDLHIHHITFVLEAQTMVHMGSQAGGQIRGALWQALSNIACTVPEERHLPHHAQYCPMCFLMERQQNSPRGQNPPRPFAIRPPLAVRAEDDRRYQAGEQFEIGMTLMGKAVQLFPYLVQGMRSVGQNGVGYGRGRFTIESISAYHPIHNERETLLEDGIVHVPSLTVREDDLNLVPPITDDSLRLRFLTPTTLKNRGKIMTYPEFEPFIARLLERCQAMAFHYGETVATADIWEPEYLRLTQLATQIERIQDNTRWVSVRSGSRRSNRYHDVGGFVGEVQFEGDIQPFYRWLLWGQSLQVGKHIVKGNGLYEIIS